MVGVRIAPDGYDIVVWKFDDSGTTFVNSSTAGVYTGAQSNLSLTGTVRTQQPSPFAASSTNSAVQFIGNDSGSPRNTINGATAVEPTYPFTVSGWYFIRSYTPNGFNPMYFSKQRTAGVWSGSSFGQIEIQGRQYAGQNTAFDFFVAPLAGGAGIIVPSDLTIPLNTWCHLGLTYDGTNFDGYINGNVVGTAVNASGPSQVDYGGHGPWFFGAVPAGSGDPQETAISVCDFRIANVIRPQTYFQNIYQSATLNTTGTISLITKYYKMRAYDLGCSRPNPVYWVDTSVSYALAPSPPCGGPLGPIEIMEIYPVLNG